MKYFQETNRQIETNCVSMPEDEVRRTPIVPLTEIVWNVMNINIHHGKSGEMRHRDDRDMSTLHIVMRYVVMYNMRFWLLPALSYWTRSARCRCEQTWNGEIFYNNLSSDEWPLWPGVQISQYLTQFDWDTRIKHGLEISIYGAVAINHDSSLHCCLTWTRYYPNHYKSILYG